MFHLWVGMFILDWLLALKGGTISTDAGWLVILMPWISLENYISKGNPGSLLILAEVPHVWVCWAPTWEIQAWFSGKRVWTLQPPVLYKESLSCQWEELQITCKGGGQSTEHTQVEPERGEAGREEQIPHKCHPKAWSEEELVWSVFLGSQVAVSWWQWQWWCY